MFFIVLSNLITLLICMLFGYVCSKKEIITGDINNGLSNLLIKLTLPCIIVFSMQKPLTDELLIEAGLMLVASALLFLGGTFVGLLFCKLLKADKSENGVWLFALTFPNIIYMGFPVIGAALGTDALFYLSIANIAFNMLSFSLGIKLIAKGYDSAETNLKGLFANPAIIATLIGFILFVFSMELPEPVNNALSMVGNMTTPISMIIIGAMLAKSNFFDAFRDIKLILLILIRLIFIPIVAFIIASMFFKDSLIIGVLVLMAGMPIASVTAIFAEKYGGNTLLASKAVFVSTLFSLFTIPIVSLIL